MLNAAKHEQSGTTDTDDTGSRCLVVHRRSVNRPRAFHSSSCVVGRCRLIYNSVDSVSLPPLPHLHLSTGRTLSGTILLSILQQTTATSNAAGNANASASERIKKKPLPKKRNSTASAAAAASSSSGSGGSPGKLMAKKKVAPANTSGGSPRKPKQQKKTEVEKEKIGDESQSEASDSGDDVAVQNKLSKKEAAAAASDALIVKDTGLSRKRMASLNASAFMAATYETEQTLDRNLSATESSSEEEDEDEEEDNKSQNTDTDAKSQQSSVPSSLGSGGSKAKSAGSARSSAASTTKRGPKKVKKEKGEEPKTVSGFI